MSKKGLWAIPALAVLIAAMLLIYVGTRPRVTEGSKSVGVNVIDDQGGEVQYFIATDAEYFRDVMDELSEKPDSKFSYGGEEGAYGFYVDTVNGVKADNKTAYWGFYVNGEYCLYGIDSQPVNDGDIFEIVYEKVE